MYPSEFNAMLGDRKRATGTAAIELRSRDELSGAVHVRQSVRVQTAGSGTLSDVLLKQDVHILDECDASQFS